MSEYPNKVWIAQGPYQLLVHKWATDPIKQKNRYPRIEYTRSDTAEAEIQHLREIVRDLVKDLRFGLAEMYVDRNVETDALKKHADKIKEIMDA